MSITYCVCVCVCIIQHAKHIFSAPHHVFICELSGYTIYFHISQKLNDF